MTGGALSASCRPRDGEGDAQPDRSSRPPWWSLEPRWLVDLRRPTFRKRRLGGSILRLGPSEPTLDGAAGPWRFAGQFTHSAVAETSLGRPSSNDEETAREHRPDFSWHQVVAGPLHGASPVTEKNSPIYVPS